MAESLPAAAEFAVFDGDLDPAWTERYLGVSALAVDTEAMGLVHGRDRLCLVQIADENDRVACIRIALGQSEAPRLRSVMEAADVEKVFHYARFDVAALASGLGIAVNPLFCTKVGSRLARTYTPRHGLKDLVMELVGVELDKGAQSSDWGRVEELSETQLAYAANDVRYLLPARRRLETMLRREGCRDLLAAVSAVFQSFLSWIDCASTRRSSIRASLLLNSRLDQSSSRKLLSPSLLLSSWFSRALAASPSCCASVSRDSARARLRSVSRVPSRAAN